MEKEPALELTMNGETFLATRQNTSMFTFLGELAIYDHIFVCMNEGSEDEQMQGAYLFKNQKIWQDLAGFIMEHQYPMHLNLPEVADCDRRAFDNTMYGDIRGTDTFPQDWVGHE